MLSDFQLENRVTELVNEFGFLESWADRLYKAWDERVAKSWLDELTQDNESQGEVVEEIFSEPPAVVQVQKPAVKPGRGGSRPGSGRKVMGKTVIVSISLSYDEWGYIDTVIQNGTYASMADYFRSCEEIDVRLKEILVQIASDNNF
ncbi:hypothetical protein G9U52_38540, partial [Paenibacillus sp. S3N08]|nr:hypothetical protein [Paenibacillus agricola]